MVPRYVWNWCYDFHLRAVIYFKRSGVVEFASNATASVYHLCFHAGLLEGFDFIQLKFLLTFKALPHFD